MDFFLVNVQHFIFNLDEWIYISQVTQQQVT